MAVGGQGNPPHRRWFEALFGEARERARRRRRRFLLVALASCAVIFGVGLVLRGGGHDAGVGVGSRVSIRSVALPAGGHYSQVAVVGKQLVLTGGWQNSPTGMCNSATVDPATLRVVAVAQASCADPRLYGRRVLPVAFDLGQSPGEGVSTLALRIATVDPHERAGYRLGPIVVRYPQCSDCRVEWIYGDGSLWVYAPVASPRFGDVGALLQVSERTGRVVRRWPMPVFTRALLAVDADGVWIAQSLFGGEPGHVPADQRIDYDSLYRAAPGMPSPIRTFDLHAWGANWLVAAGHRVWLDIAKNNGTSRLWRLDGATAKPGIRSRALAAGWDCVQAGEGSTTIAGSDAAGIYCVGGGPLRLRSVDPITGATHALPDPGFGGGPAVALGRSVFFLPASPGGWGTRVYRVTPR